MKKTKNTKKNNKKEEILFREIKESFEEKKSMIVSKCSEFAC